MENSHSDKPFCIIDEQILTEIEERWGPVFEALRRYDSGDPDYLRGLDE